MVLKLMYNTAYYTRTDTEIRKLRGCSGRELLRRLEDRAQAAENPVFLKNCGTIGEEQTDEEFEPRECSGPTCKGPKEKKRNLPQSDPEVGTRVKRGYMPSPASFASAADMSMMKSGGSKSEATEVAAPPHAHAKNKPTCVVGGNSSSSSWEAAVYRQHLLSYTFWKIHREFCCPRRTPPKAVFVTQAPYQTYNRVVPPPVHNVSSKQIPTSSLLPLWHFTLLLTKSNKR
ncbi:hypothetical protein quinque_013956 [Culex quinquefasciatus]